MGKCFIPTFFPSQCSSVFTLPLHDLNLSLNNLPSEKELLSAFKCLKNNEAYGPDNISVELSKEEGIHIQKQLQQLITKMWQQEEVLFDFRNTLIMNVYKRK